jgi:hypothetical protein
MREKRDGARKLDIKHGTVATFPFSFPTVPCGLDWKHETDIHKCPGKVWVETKYIFLWHNILGGLPPNPDKILQPHGCDV